MKVVDLGWAVARITYNQNFKEICIMSPYETNETAYMPPTCVMVHGEFAFKQLIEALTSAVQDGA
jgi:hypothetical protein